MIPSGGFNPFLAGFYSRVIVTVSWHGLSSIILRIILSPDIPCCDRLPLRTRERIAANFREPLSRFTHAIRNVGFATPAGLLPQIGSR